MPAIAEVGEANDGITERVNDWNIVWRLFCETPFYKTGVSHSRPANPIPAGVEILGYCLSD